MHRYLGHGVRIHMSRHFTNHTLILSILELLRIAKTMIIFKICFMVIDGQVMAGHVNDHLNGLDKLMVKMKVNQLSSLSELSLANIISANHMVLQTK